MSFEKKIIDAIETFELSLKNRHVLTEAASGNYVVTPVIAALAGAKVSAIAGDSSYATYDEVVKQTRDLAAKLGVEERITIYPDINKVDLEDIDVVTNTGFVRPITKSMIERLPSHCAIPLMWEPWEYREADLDLEACAENRIKVYGTNEEDKRLRTMEYVGYIVLYQLLDNKISPFSGKILLLGNNKFTDAIVPVLEQNGYFYKQVKNYEDEVDISLFNTIIVAEHLDDRLLIGSEEGYIKSDLLGEEDCVIHIAGNVEMASSACKLVPKSPACFGHMSFTTDYVDAKALIDLHTAGLKVAEGMILANSMNLTKGQYKDFMEANYPALSFENEKYW